MKIINIVSSINKINYGVWHAATIGSHYMKTEHKVESELWICYQKNEVEIIPEIPYFFFKKEQKTIKGFNNWLSQFSNSETIIVTHGSWLMPTKLGYWAKKRGFSWVYLPQGMFEVLSTSKLAIKKRLYFHLFEKRWIKNATVVRAVSYPEEKNLIKLIPGIPLALIYNGVNGNSTNTFEKSDSLLNFLFLARLHSKKGIIHLVKAWAEAIDDSDNVLLSIVGPDEGELEKIKPYLRKTSVYLGPKFGSEKSKLLENSHYYILPSYSEGFPTSVLEAMSYGAIPIITKGCNFPDIITHKLGYEIEPDIASIKNVLSNLKNKAFDKKLSLRNIEYVENNFSENKIGENLLNLYTKILSKN